MATQLSEFIWANHPGVRCSNPKHLFHLKSNFVLYLLFIVLRKGRKEQLKDHKHNYYFDHTQPFTAEFEFVFAQSFAERVDCCWLLLLLSLVALLLLTMLSSWSLFTQATIYELKYWVEPPFPFPILKLKFEAENFSDWMNVWSWCWWSIKRLPLRLPVGHNFLFKSKASFTHFKADTSIISDFKLQYLFS